MIDITVHAPKTNTSRRTEVALVLEDHHIVYVGLDGPRAKKTARTARRAGHRVEVQRKLVTGSDTLVHYTVILTK